MPAAGDWAYVPTRDSISGEVVDDAFLQLSTSNMPQIVTDDTVLHFVNPFDERSVEVALRRSAVEDWLWDH